MTELTAQSTFREFAQVYFKSKIICSKTSNVIAQKSRYNNALCSSLGDMVLANIDYNKCIDLLSELREKGYSKKYIFSCWCIIKEVISMATELKLIEKQEFHDKKTTDINNNLKIRTDNSLTKQISESYQNAYGLADFIITRHTSVFSYLIFLYNKNDVRQHHKLPKYILTFLYKTIDKDILNKPLKEVNQYDVRKVNHDIRLLNKSSETVRQNMQHFRFLFTYAYENGLIDTLLYDFFEVPHNIVIQKYHYNDEEYASIKGAINKSELKNLYIVAESAGLFRSEVLAIETNSYNADEGLLTIESRLVRGKKQKLVKENYTITKKRTIKLPEVAVKALNNEIEKREMKKLLAGEDWNSASNYIFTDNLGNHVDEETIKHDVNVIKIISGVESFNLKELRSNAIYMMAANNIPVHQLLEYLGLKFERSIPKLRNITDSTECDWRESIL